MEEMQPIFWENNLFHSGEQTSVHFLAATVRKVSDSKNLSQFKFFEEFSKIKKLSDETLIVEVQAVGLRQVKFGYSE